MENLKLFDLRSVRRRVFLSEGVKQASDRYNVAESFRQGRLVSR